eukprot:CAMPEP_0182419176 /NCGR_PEP_ID=MMETSP1167-20130531/3576_1 /TAXON_ID=2988 /ORGANISM="Mallomonas Sp, Strain CCMP3275" /LENGTH=885 /DNA_ID=CAMNT_0024593847 /DNA_START=296 /DNA_END=2953 /DNA_ORIENTATION=+
MPQPDASNNPIYQKFCGDDPGQYYFFMMALEDSQNTWEIIWTVEINESGEIFTGGVNTQMVFDFEEDTENWYLLTGENFHNDQTNSTQCGFNSNAYLQSGACEAEYDDAMIDGEGGGNGVSSSEHSSFGVPTHFPTHTPKKSIIHTPPPPSRVGRGVRPQYTNKANKISGARSGDGNSGNSGYGSNQTEFNNTMFYESNDDSSSGSYNGDSNSKPDQSLQSQKSLLLGSSSNKDLQSDLDEMGDFVSFRVPRELFEPNVFSRGLAGASKSKKTKGAVEIRHHIKGGYHTSSPSRMSSVSDSSSHSSSGSTSSNEVDSDNMLFEGGMLNVTVNSTANSTVSGGGSGGGGSGSGGSDKGASIELKREAGLISKLLLPKSRPKHKTKVTTSHPSLAPSPKPTSTPQQIGRRKRRKKSPSTPLLGSGDTAPAVVANIDEMIDSGKDLKNELVHGRAHGSYSMSGGSGGGGGSGSGGGSGGGASNDTVVSESESAASWASLTVTMFDDNGDGWSSQNRTIGAQFYISDETKTQLLAYGSLANGSYSGYCEYCMTDGSYYFRVSMGESLGNEAWAFCHTNGSTGEELAFHIEDGECYPDALLGLENIVSETYYTVVTVSGMIAVEGVTSEIFDDNDQWAVVTTLGSSIYGWDPSFTEINSVRLNEHHTNFIASSVMSRKLSAFTYDIEFETSFVSEIAYEVDGTSYAAVKRLVDNLKAQFADALESGEFSKVLKDVAMDGNIRSLEHANRVQLLALNVKEINYIGTIPLTIRDIPLQQQSIDVKVTESKGEATVRIVEEVIEVVQTSILSSIDLSVLLVVGFVLMVGVFVRIFKDRQNEIEVADDDYEPEAARHIPGGRVTDKKSKAPTKEPDNFVDSFVLLHPVTRKQHL